MEPTENWLPVVGYEGWYEVSDLGRVRSVSREVRTGVGTRHMQGRVLRPFTRADGRYSVTLSRDDERRTRLVHRMVLEAFVGPQPTGAECCHHDGDPTNNRLTNLRWDTHTGNEADKRRHGTHPSSAKTHCKRGHQLVEPNLKPAQFAKGKRSCLACSREYGLAVSQGRPFDPELADERYRALGF
ncbi:hypothetical protein L332_03560 [Agrococcus pavilionensis RW1]|uniref:HNH nuclease domain-containing protein n=1 Tax=Agrococcus pavilionensis RW1 TaxID=1330458 RepID=U1MNJ5_9MICO|nr:NUMOD4 motif-containing HNH endonuclease [Agrococcus pavilionensis]ERG63471.1 hypothetical protein L332_03560 [Agrococcus pavilionensis RW1]